MYLIDSHCHLSDFYHKGTLDAVLERAGEGGVEHVITVGTSAADWYLYRELTAGHPEIYYTVGLHPGDIDDDWEEQIKQVSKYFSCDTPPVAIGEIGLDHFYLPDSTSEAAVIKDRQQKVFERQLSLASQLGCPVVIHSRKAFNDCVRVIDDSGIDWNKVLLHCFDHGPGEIQTINERGGRGSFTGIITYKNGHSVRQAALAQGLDLIMVETDSPYLAPVPKRGKPNEPAFLSFIAEFCADLFKIDPDSFADKATANTREFFGLV